MLEGKSADRRDVAAKRQHARAGRQDFVGRDVVAHLQQHGSFKLVGQRSNSGSETMFGPL